MARGLFASLAVIVVLSSCGLFVDEKALLERAQASQRKGDLRAAAIDLKNLLQKNPKNVEARFALGMVNLDGGDPTSAVREFERLRAEGMPVARVAEPMARGYQATREYDKAIAILNESLPSAVDKDRMVALRLRGEIKLAQQKFGEAKTDFDEALKITNNDARALLGLVGVAEATEGSTAALSEAEKALAAAPNDPLVYIARGGLLLQAKRAEEAGVSFQKAAELATEPNRRTELLSALGGLSQAQIGVGKIDEALKSTARMQELAPNLPLTRYARAYALAQKGELDQARELLEQNVAKVDDPRSQLLLGAVNLTLGRYSQAEMGLSTVVAASPGNVEARQLLAQARLRQSKPADALDTLLPVISNDKETSANLLALAGQASLAAGKTKEGVALLKRNVDANPENVSAQLDLAAGYLSAGQSDQALSVLGGAHADKAGAEKAPENEDQIVRREYLATLAQLQKGDMAGASAQAMKAAQARPQNASLQMLASSVLARQRQFDKARPYAEAVIKLKPDAAAGYTNLGRLDLADGKVDPARDNFRKALQKQPGDAMAATSLALVELGAQKADAALSVLSEFRKHNTDAVEPRVLESQVLLSRGKVDEAEKLARETVEKAGDNPSALAVLARILSTQSRHAESLTMFERAVRAEPKSAPLRFQQALAQRAAGQPDDALASAREALKIDPRYLPALQLEGLISVGKGDLTTASKNVDTLLKIAPDQATTHELSAIVKVAQKQFDEAARAYRKASELSPQPQFAVGEHEARVRGKLPSPVEPLERFLAIQPKEPSTRIMLAMYQQERGDRAAAIKSYEEVLSNYPKSPVALNNLAWMRHQDGKPDAVDLARRAYEVAPKSPAIIDTYAWILVNSGKAAEAFKLLDPLVGSASNDGGKSAPADVRAHYAVVLSKSGRDAEAKVLAKELTTSKAAELSADMKTLMDNLAKS